MMLVPAEYALQLAILYRLQTENVAKSDQIIAIQRDSIGLQNKTIDQLKKIKELQTALLDKKDQTIEKLQEQCCLLKDRLPSETST